MSAAGRIFEDAGARAATWFAEAATKGALRATRIGREATATVAAPDAAARTEALRVLIYSADLGGGHDAMANALKGELLTRYGDDVVVEVRNGLQIGNPVLHKMMRNGYEAQIEHAPATWKLLYNVLGTPTTAYAAEGVTSALTAPRLLRDIHGFRPDVVMSTFPHVTGTLGNLRAAGKLEVPAMGVVIDSHPHVAWVHPGIDEHIVMNADDVPGLARFGTRDMPIHARAVRPPVDPRFFVPVDRAAARAEFGLPADDKVLLVSGGSWGIALPDEQLRRILDQTDLHLVVATGRNTEALAHLQATFPADRVTPVPFTREMPKLMAASDCVLVNAAGMTTMESFASGRPVVLYKPIPGHGVDGASALDADGLATYAADADDAVAVLKRLETGDDADLAARVTKARAMFDGERASDVVMARARSSRIAGNTSHT
jgi:UDP-N-acetylglucosamine:LPS N-acetylglucosamine transferase